MSQSCSNYKKLDCESASQHADSVSKTPFVRLERLTAASLKIVEAKAAEIYRSPMYCEESGSRPRSEQSYTKRKPSMSMPPKQATKRKLVECRYVNDDELKLKEEQPDVNRQFSNNAKGNLFPSIPPLRREPFYGPNTAMQQDSEACSKPLQRSFKKMINKPLSIKEFRLEHFFATDAKVLMNMVQVYCNNSVNRPIVRPSKIVPVKGHFATILRSFLDLAKFAETSAEDDLPDLFTKNLKRKRKRRKRIRRSKTDVVDVDLSRLFLEQPSSVAEMQKNDARMGDTGKRSRLNPFGDTESVGGPTTTCSRGSLFDDLVEDEAREGTSSHASVATGIVPMEPVSPAEARAHDSGICDREASTPQSARPKIRSATACKSLPPKIRLCDPLPVNAEVAKAGKWSVYRRMYNFVMMSADHEMMGFRLPLKGKTHCLRSLMKQIA